MKSYFFLLLTVLALFYLYKRDCKQNRNIPHALWIPTIWLGIIGSRSVAAWLNLGVRSGGDYASLTQEGNPIDRNFFIFLMLLGIVILMKRQDKMKVLFSQNKILLCYLLYCVISIVWSDYPVVAAKRFVRFLGVLTMVLVVLSHDSPYQAVRCLIRRTSYFLVAVSILFIRYLPEYGRYYNRWTYEVAYSGVCTEKNALGSLAMIAGIFFLWEIINKEKKITEQFLELDFWINCSFLLSSVYLLSIADSSTSTLCFIVGAGLLFLTNTSLFKNAPHTIGLTIGLLGGFVIGAQLLFDIKNKIFIALGRSPDLTSRLPLWEILFDMVDHPLILGTGYESFWTVDRMSYLWSIGKTANQSHNGYIDMYLNLGVVGVFFFVAFILLAYMRASKEFSYSFSMAQIKLVHVVVFCLMNYTEAVFPRPTFQSMLFFIFFMFNSEHFSLSSKRNNLGRRTKVL